MKKRITGMISALWAVRPSNDVLKRAAMYSLILFFAAHAFCFFNLTYSGDAVMLTVSRGSASQFSGGQYLQPFYWMLRGGISAPLWVGLLSAVYLTLAAAAVARLLDIRSLLGLFSLCGVLIANPAVTSICAASLHTADAAFLALFLSCVCALLSLRTAWGFLPGACLLAAALAMDPFALSCAAALMLTAFIRDLLCEENGRSLLCRAGKALCALAGGLLIYLAGYMVLARLKGFDASAAWHAGSLLAAPGMLFAPLTAYPHLNAVLRIALIALAFAFLLPRVRQLPLLRTVLLAASVCALPFASNLPVFSAQAPGQTSLAYPLLDLLPVALIFAGNAMFSCARRLRQAAACAFGVLFLGVIVFSNQVYLKKNLEFESTVSVMTRVIDRAEQTEGYQPGATPVAIVGTLEDSVLSVPRIGFEHLEALDAASGHYAPQSSEDNLWYVWSVLGYPFNFIDQYQQEQLSARAEVISMPAFPAEGCCAMIDGILVIKLSD